MPSAVKAARDAVDTVRVSAYTLSCNRCHLGRALMGVHLIDSALFGDQFGTEAMRGVFGDDQMVRAWMRAEGALAVAEGKVGLIPNDAAQVISARAASFTWDPAELAAGIAHTFHP